MMMLMTSTRLRLAATIYITHDHTVCDNLNEYKSSSCSVGDLH
jgi:hypothetical protein